MPDLKPGDRVEYIGDALAPFYGDLGTVRDSAHAGPFVIVRFDKPIGRTNRGFPVYMTTIRTDALRKVD